VGCKARSGETSLAKVRALVAAAGRGSRTGLPYPKTLFPIQGKPILVRILEVLAPYDSTPTVVVSPEGREPIRKSLAKHQKAAHLVVQPSPRGMGDAVLRFSQSPAYVEADDVLLVWGDIPFIQSATVSKLFSAHKALDNDFTFATRRVRSAYTLVLRDAVGRVTGVVETREMGVPQIAGERDIGLFVFRKTIVLDMLRQELPGKWGKTTGEHGFLYIVAAMVSHGLRVAALPIAAEQDLVSFNKMEDLDAHPERLVD
jgi:bifunctional UDP-N-acetylglucosamine pyrophosphorylase/glucosamine-1-phosphate N-acetyltransferase